MDRVTSLWQMALSVRLGDLDWILKVMRSQGMSSREHDLLSCVLPVFNQCMVMGLCHRRASF